MATTTTTTFEYCGLCGADLTSGSEEVQGLCHDCQHSADTFEDEGRAANELPAPDEPAA